MQPKAEANRICLLKAGSMRLALLYSTLSVGFLLVWAQCLPSIPPPPTCPPTCQALVGNTVPANSVRCVTGSRTINGNLTFQPGSRLIVCGQLTVNGVINMASNCTLFVAPGGVVTTTQNLLLGGGSSNSGVYNYGTFNITSAIYLNNPTSFFYVFGSGAVLNSQNIEIHGTLGIYGGTIQLSSFATAVWIQSSGRICMANGGCLSMTGGNFNFANYAPNGIVVVGNNPVVFAYQGGTAWLNENLTNSPNLYVCVRPGSNIVPPPRWGAAQVTYNCTRPPCEAPLSYVSLQVRGWRAAQEVRLTWEARGALPLIRSYRVQLEMADKMLPLGEVATAPFHFPLRLLPSEGPWSFRVEALSAAGEVLAVGRAQIDPMDCDDLHVFPNPFSDRLYYTFCGEKAEEAFLYDAQGRLVERLRLEPSGNSWEMPPNLSPGLYFLQVPSRSITLRLLRE